MFDRRPVCFDAYVMPLFYLQIITEIQNVIFDVLVYEYVITLDDEVSHSYFRIQLLIHPAF